MSPAASCSVCGRVLGKGSGFVLAGARRCTRCTLLRSRLLFRSLLTGLVVGTILVAINHGNEIATGHFDSNLVWKVPLTYCTPFCVATWGALVNSRPPALISRRT
jgi:hypothetical protein